MKKNILLGLLAFALSASAQQKTEVTEFNLAGPFKVTAPLKFDTVDVKGNKYDEKSQLASLALKAEPTTVFSGKVLPKIEGERSVGVLTFYMTNSDYLKGKLKVKGPKNYKLYIDGKESTGDLNLIPEHHTFAIRYLAEPTYLHIIDLAKSELYGGQQQTFVAPYTKCDRIEDYRTAWAHFEKIFDR